MKKKMAKREYEIREKQHKSKTGKEGECGGGREESGRGSAAVGMEIDSSSETKS